MSHKKFCHDQAKRGEDMIWSSLFRSTCQFAHAPGLPLDHFTFLIDCVLYKVSKWVIAMQHTGPDVVIKALQHHNIPRPLMHFVHFLCTKRTITTSHQGRTHTLTCMVSKGCPGQHLIRSLMLWNLVANSLMTTNWSQYLVPWICRWYRHYYRRYAYQYMFLNCPMCPL